jgi:hypothetical protein
MSDAPDQNEQLRLALALCEPLTPPRRASLGEQWRVALYEAECIRASQAALIRCGHRAQPDAQRIAAAEALESTMRLIDWILRTPTVLALLKEASRKIETDKQ